MVPSEDVRDETAREFAARFTNESFSEAAALLADDGRETVVESLPEVLQRVPVQDTDAALEQYWRGLRGQYDQFENVDGVTVEGDEATVRLQFTSGTQAAVLSFDDAGGVTDVSFPSEYTPPTYADQAAFTERDVTVDGDDVSLGGTLTIPDAKTPVPGVVLVHGAGLHDQDGTAGASKILRDLAWGLATNGIAALRYEKRLYEHDVAPESHDLDTVVVDDAVAAVSELTAADEVDADSVFVAGHSQGGMSAPRIAERDGNLAGIVSLDGPADMSIDERNVELAKYSFSPDGELDEDQRAMFEEQKAELETLISGDYDADDIVMGRPGAFHQSMEEADPLGTATDLDVPILAAVTAGRADPETQRPLIDAKRDQFEEWQAAGSTDDDRFEYYENVGHYFQHGETPALTLGYLHFGGNVADYVMADVAEWIHDVAEE